MSDRKAVVGETWAAMVAQADLTIPAVVSADFVLTRSELFAAASGAIGWLDDIGVPRGCTVPALLGSCRDGFALALAGALSGRPLAPLNPRATIREVSDQLHGLDNTALVVLPNHAEFGTAVSEATGVRLAVADDLPVSVPDLDWYVDPSDPVIVIHTSGTTGQPKAITLSEGRLAARARRFAEVVGLGPGSVFTSGSSFHHIAGAGIFLTALACGTSLAEFDAFSEETWVRMGQLGVTHALLVPTMIERLLDSGRLGLPGLVSIQYGGAPIRPETVRRLSEDFPHIRLTQIYGQTEGSPITALTHAQHLAAAEAFSERLGSVGTAIPGVELRISCTDDRGVGELLAHATHFFAPEADGWLHTGDLARIDADGFVYLHGRKGDMINRGGENIFPLDVERVIAEHADVSDVAVVGVADRELGQRVKAVVVLVPGAQVSAQQLTAHTRASLSGYKVPEVWDFVSKLPRNPAGKVVRARLK